MTYMPQLTRRSFVASVAALGGGLALGFHLPTGTAPARAAAGGAEVNAWVVIQPDDTVIIRVARSEMGQGITTALPMLVAEELECDWSKVRAEFPTADENLRRHRRLGRHVDGRQPVGARLAGIPSQSGRRGSGDADRRRRAAMECSGRRVSGGEERRHPQADAVAPCALARSRKPPRNCRRRPSRSSRIRRTGRSSGRRKSASTRWTR